MKAHLSTYFQWGPLVLLKRQREEDTEVGYKEYPSSFQIDPLVLYCDRSVYRTDTQEPIFLG